jgi:hypothetical protein
MCDCYEQKCEIEGCKEEIPIHIQDFNFPRKDVKVFCNKHLPKEKATIFEVIKTDGLENNDDEYEKIGWKCAIRLCKGRVAPELVGVEPNICADCKTYYLE